MIEEIINATVTVLIIAIFVRSILSWFPNVDPRNPAVEFLVTVTEPILAPIRSVMPRGMMLDFTPMIAIFLLIALRTVLLSGV